MLKIIKILRARLDNWDAYPFSVSVIRSLDGVSTRHKHNVRRGRGVFVLCYRPTRVAQSRSYQVQRGRNDVS